MAYLKNAESLPAFVETLSQDSIKYGCIQSLDQLNSENAEQVRRKMIDKLYDYLPKSVISAKVLS